MVTKQRKKHACLVYTTPIAASICSLCAVYATFFRPEQRQPTHPADWSDRWEKECGTRFVDDIWNGYARRFIRARRIHENEQCLENARALAQVRAAQAAVVKVLTSLKSRYPDNRLPVSTMPLASEESIRVHQFWSQPEHVADAELFFNNHMNRGYPEPEGPSEHWQREVIMYDMMGDLENIYASRDHGAAEADTTSCKLRPEVRTDVERVFDDMILHLFEAADPCARMYMGFGNSEVQRLWDRAVRKYRK